MKTIVTIMCVTTDGDDVIAETYRVEFTKREYLLELLEYIREFDLGEVTKLEVNK